MTTQTFQGLMRTTMGRPRSEINATSGLPMQVLTGTPLVMLQLHVPAATPVGSTIVGLIPKGFVIDEMVTITGTDTNITVSLPAYATLDEVADLSAAAQYTMIERTRPVEIDVAVEAQADDVIFGVRGWALDNSALD